MTGITLSNSLLLPRQLDVELLRTEFEAGNQEALALAIHLCGQRALTLPPWVAEAWKKGCYDISDRKVESWDEVLANGKRKTVKQLRREQTDGQKKWLIQWGMETYRNLPIKRVGDRKGAPDRFDVIAADLTGQGKRSKEWDECTRSEAKTLYYELFPPSRRPPRLPKSKGK